MNSSLMTANVLNIILETAYFDTELMNSQIHCAGLLQINELSNLDIGLLLYANVFTHNIGCFRETHGLIELQCNQNEDESQERDIFQQYTVAEWVDLSQAQNALKGLTINYNSFFILI